MTYIDSLTNILATMLCQYLKAESQNATESVPAITNNQTMKKGSDGRDGEDIPKTKELAS